MTENSETQTNSWDIAELPLYIDTTHADFPQRFLFAILDENCEIKKYWTHFHKEVSRGTQI